MAIKIDNTEIARLLAQRRSPKRSARTPKRIASELARALSHMKTRPSGGGSKRRIAHDPAAHYCRCVDCRKQRGDYPAHLIGGRAL